MLKASTPETVKAHLNEGSIKTKKLNYIAHRAERGNIMTKYTTTKAEMFATVISIVEASEAPNKEELVERLNHEIALLSKKTTSKASLEKAETDKTLTGFILGVLMEGGAYTVSEIQAKCPELSVTAGISNSKVTSLLGKMVTAGTVTRVKDKKKSLYSMA